MAVIHRSWLHVALLGISMHLIGCQATLKPTPTTRALIRQAPLFRLANIEERIFFEGREVGTAGPFANVMVGDLLSADLRDGSSGTLFAEDEDALPTELYLEHRLVPHYGNLLWALLCGLTLGLGPVHVVSERKTTCTLSVYDHNEVLFDKFTAEEDGLMDAWCYPPGLITLIGAAFREGAWWEEIRRALSNNLCAKLNEHALRFYPKLASLKDKPVALAQTDSTPELQPTLPEGGTPPNQLQPKDFVWRQADGSRVWLLAVGISEYRDAKIPRLRFAKEDAHRFADWVQRQTALSISSETVTVLSNEQATRKCLLTAVDRLRRQVTPEDLVVLYMSCHGAPELSRGGQGVDAKYLVLYDAEVDNRNCLAPSGQTVSAEG